MPNLYGRQVALSDVSGRIDYISNPLRQEHLLAACDTASELLDGRYWEILARESQEANAKYGNPSKGKVEARELHTLLPNELLERMTPDEIVETAAANLSAYLGRPVNVTLHFNKTLKSLHLHAIYAERELLQEPEIKVAPRALFFDEEGKRRYKKAEILDENGELRDGCRIVAKGEIYESRCFGAVDPKYSSKTFLYSLKHDCLLKLRNGELKGDIEITEYDKSTGMLPQMYVGKDKPADMADKIRAYNALVREYNDAVKTGFLSREDALEMQKVVMASSEKNEDLQWYIDQIRAYMAEERQEPRKLGLDDQIARSSSKTGGYWRRYAEIRDTTWGVFVEGQRKEFKAIRACQTEKTDLEIRRWQGRLSETAFREHRSELREEISTHKNNLATQRKYQEVAKGRQKIVRALLLAGADERTVNSAMREYQEAMELLQTYIRDGDYEGRRLKAAQWSLGQAQARAERYIAKLEEEKLQEECDLEKQAEREYQDFQRDGSVEDEAEIDTPELLEEPQRDTRRQDLER